MGSANEGFTKVTWVDSAMNWTREELLELLQKTFEDFDDNAVDWWEEGLTPHEAVYAERYRRGKNSRPNFRDV